MADDTIAPATVPTAAPTTPDPTAGAPPVVAPDPVAGVAPASQPEPTAKQFAALVKADRAIRAREAEIKRVEAEHAKRASEWAAREKLAKDDPFEFLAKSGLTYQQLTDLALKGGKGAQTEIDRRIAEVQAKVDAFEAAQRESAEKATKAEQDRAEAVQQRYRDGMRELAETSDDYRAVRLVGDEAYEVAWQVVVGHFEQTGEALSRDAALKRVEDHYRKIISEGATALGLVSAAPTDPKGSATDPEQTKQTTSKTLTNALAQQATPSPTKQQDRQERLREAAARMFAARAN